MSDPAENQPPRRGVFYRLMVALIVALMVGTGLLTFLAVVYHQDLRRWIYVRKVLSDDAAQQARGLGYIVRNLSQLRTDDPQRQRLVADVRRMMDRENDEVFRRLVAGLAEGGLWGREFHPPAWIRHLTGRVDQLPPEKRVSVAVELGRLLWKNRALGREGRVADAVARLLEDADDNVRFNALSAAACLPDPRRAELIRSRTLDGHPVIARHAWIMTGLLHPAATAGLAFPDDRPDTGDPFLAMAQEFVRGRMTGEKQPAPLRPLPGASEVVEELAALEARPARSVDLEIREDMPDLIRLEVARVSRTAQPEDLLRVFHSEHPTTRDLACVSFFHRFGDEAGVELAKQLVASFDDNPRMSGAILAGMTKPDEKLWQMLKLRASQAHLGWAVHRHYSLALWMLGEKVTETVEEEDGRTRQVAFDPVLLLQQPRMPRTTVTLALLHGGRLEGLDYYLNPFGQPPVALELLLDQLRYVTVLRRYLPQMPEFWVWGTVERQKFQVEVIRDWYLLFRNDLVFDPASRTFRVAGLPGES